MKKVTRRSLMFAGLGGAGVALVAAAERLGDRLRGRSLRKSKGSETLGGVGVYDLSAYQKADPELILYKEEVKFPTGLNSVTAIACGPDDEIYITGDTLLKSFKANMTPRLRKELSGPPQALTVGNDGTIYVSLKDRVAVFDSQGTSLFSIDNLGPKAWITSLDVTEKDIFLADAGNRDIIRCDKKGNVTARFGNKDESGENPGFVVPSPYFELAVSPSGFLKVANPGKHRVETYSLDGKFISAWGTPSMKIDGFSGCCNPANFALLPDGSFVTSEKGLNRVKIYDADGNFKGVVAAPDHLIKDPEFAIRSCNDCSVGFSMPVTVDPQGRVYILDTLEKLVRVFTPLDT